MLVSVWSVLELNQLPVCISDVRLSVRVTVPADTPIVSRLVQLLTDSLRKLLPRCLQSTTNYRKYIYALSSYTQLKLQTHTLLQLLRLSDHAVTKFHCIEHI